MFTLPPILCFNRERLRSLSFSQVCMYVCMVKYVCMYVVYNLILLWRQPSSSSSRNIIPLPPSVPNRTSRSNTMVTSNSSISSATNAIAQPTGTGTSSIAAGSSSRANNNLESGCVTPLSKSFILTELSRRNLNYSIQYICVCVYVYVCVYVCMYVCMYGRPNLTFAVSLFLISACMCVRTVCMYECMYVCMYLFNSVLNVYVCV